MVPTDMHAKTNAIYNLRNAELKESNDKLEQMEIKLNILKIKNAELELELHKRDALIEQMKAHKKGIEAGKVVNLFGSN